MRRGPTAADAARSGDVPGLCLDQQTPRGCAMTTHAHEAPPPRGGGCRGWHTDGVGWNPGSVVVGTLVGEASKESPDGSTLTTSPHLSAPVCCFLAARTPDSMEPWDQMSERTFLLGLGPSPPWVTTGD